MEYIFGLIGAAVVLAALDYIRKFIRRKAGLMGPTANQIPKEPRPAPAPSQPKIASDPGATIILFQNSKNIFIDAEDNVKISKPNAIERIKNQATETETSDNFIGFINTKSETLQFLRRGENIWSLDSPITVDGSYSSSFQKDNLPTDQVIQITSTFFDGGEWKKM